MTSRPPIVVPKSPASASPPAASPPRGDRVSGELTPPPADGYYDLALDDPEPQNPKDTHPAQMPEAAPPSPLRGPATPEAERGASFLATAGKSAAKRRLGVPALVAIAAGVVLFGAVGATALKRPQREEERVSRALLPRAEWATSARGEAAPSPEVLARLEAEDESESSEAPAAPARARDRTRSRLASRQVAPGAATRAVLDVRGQTVPVPQAAAEAAVPAAAVSPPAVASVNPAAEPVDDAPQFARQGFRSPAQETPNCVQSSVRIPRDLQDFASGPITVRFAVDKDGSVGLFRMEGQAPDRRIADAVWSAVRDCRFIPGADDQGRPTRLWVVLPIRFVR